MSEKQIDLDRMRKLANAAKVHSQHCMASCGFEDEMEAALLAAADEIEHLRKERDALLHEHGHLKAECAAAIKAGESVQKQRNELFKERDALLTRASAYREGHRVKYPGGCFSTIDDPRFRNKYDHRCGLCKKFDAVLAAQGDKPHDR